MKPLSLSLEALALPFAVATLLGATIATAPVRAAPPDPEAAGETFSGVSDVTVVEVPVQVVHKGRPVRDLGPEDFHVYDEDTLRPVASFEVIDLARTPAPGPAGTAGAGGETPAVTGAGRRHFLLLFDLAFSEPHDLSRAERAARELVEGSLHPSDLVGVAFYSPRRGASMLVNFTTDRGQVLRVLDGLRVLLDGGEPSTAHGDAVGRRDPLGLTAGSIHVVLADIGAAAGVETSLAEQAIRGSWAGPRDKLGGRYEYNKLSNMMWSAEQQIHDRRAGKVADLSRSLASLARQTAGIRGAKHLVLLSGGFDADLLQPKIEAGPRMSDHAWWATGGGGWILDEVDSMIEELRRAGWLVHAVELAGLDGAGGFEEGLFFVARETGGALYGNANDLSEALGEVVDATNVTYLLTFSVDSLPPEPAFRNLRVEVDGLPRGARVTHRAGYSTPRAYGTLTPAEQRSAAHELLFSGKDQDAIGAQVMALPGRAGDGRWRVSLVLELDGEGLLAGPAAREAGAEIYAYAFDGGGRIADFLAHRVAISRAETTALLEGGGLKFLGDLGLPAGGRYTIRVLARSLRDGAATVRTVPLDLPAAGDGRSVLLPPVLLQGDESRWVVVHELPAAAASGERPFTLHGRELLPSAGTVMDGTGETRFLILGYGLSASHPGLEARITTPSGELMETARPSFLGRIEARGDEPELIVASVETAALDPGTYALEVVLRDPEGRPRGRVATPIRVRASGHD